MRHNDKEIEDLVIGGLLIDPVHVPEIIQIAREEFFYDKANATIFRAIRTMHESRKHIDILTVTRALNDSGHLEFVGGAYEVSKKTDRVASSANIVFHARILHQLYVLRELAKIGANLHATANGATSDECHQVLDDAMKKLAELNTATSAQIKTVGDVFDELTTGIRTVHELGVKPGMPTGLENLDRHIGGWQRGTLNIIAARPGMGKTAFALKCAKTPAMEHKKPVGVFSLEMGDKQLVGRLAASESGISSSRINQSDITPDELRDMVGKCFDLIGAPIYIDDTPQLRMAQLRAKAQRLVYEKGVELIIVDYLQLAHGDERGNREQEISYISRNLKAMAKELNIPVIALSQLSRQVENRDDKRPQLSDLRESGAIEQDADLVAFLFRPEYYKDLDVNNTGYEYKGECLPTKHLMILDIAKGREVRTGELMLKFFGETMQVENYTGLRKDISHEQWAAPMGPNTSFLNQQQLPPQDRNEPF